MLPEVGSAEIGTQNKNTLQLIVCFVFLAYFARITFCYYSNIISFIATGIP